jgi:hypothetical protein
MVQAWKDSIDLDPVLSALSCPDGVNSTSRLEFLAVGVANCHFRG